MSRFDWMEKALCAEIGTDLFVQDQGGHSTPQAKAICSSCQARSSCLDYGLSDPSLIGIYGGLTVKERQSLRKQMRVT